MHRLKKKFWIILFSVLGGILLVYLLSLKANKLPAFKVNRPVAKQADHTVTGIEAGTGEMALTQKALSQYGLKKTGWQLSASSTAIMLSQLKKAIKNHQAIVITGWIPHWMNAKYKLKFLKDPKNIYGSTEHQSVIAKKGLKKQNPGAFIFLKNFYLTPDKIQPALEKINRGQSLKAAISQYLKNNPQQVKNWNRGVPDGHGKKITIGRTNYLYETWSTKMVEKVLRNRGYKVADRQLDVGILWQALVSKSIDANINAELPVAQGIYARKYKGKYNNISTSLKKARIGLVVPRYMKKTHSISDLNR